MIFNFEHWTSFFIMPSAKNVCFMALALTVFTVAAMPTSGNAVSLAKPAIMETSLEVRQAKPWDGTATLDRRNDPNARLAAYSQGQAIALAGLVAGTCSTASIIPAGVALPVCATALILLAINVLWQTVGMYATARGGGGDKRGLDGTNNNIVWYYGHTAEASFKQQVQSDYDLGDGHPVPVGHLHCDDGTSICHKAWYSYTKASNNGTAKSRNRVHITPPDHQWDDTNTKPTATKAAILPRQSVHGVGADGADSSGHDYLYGGWIWEDADLATEAAMAKENAKDAGDNILLQMNEQYKTNGFFGNTGVYCMGLKENANSDIANTGYLWYYQSLDQYKANQEPEYMDQCQNV